MSCCSYTPCYCRHAKAHPSWNFGIRVTCCRVCLFRFKFDLADVKTRKSAFKRGFSASVAKEPNVRPSMNEWGIHMCSCAQQQQQIMTRRKRKREREREVEIYRKSMFPWFPSQNMLLFRFQFLYGSGVFHFTFFPLLLLRLHNLVFSEYMNFMRFCLILRIDPITFIQTRK